MKTTYPGQGLTLSLVACRLSLVAVFLAFAVLVPAALAAPPAPAKVQVPGFYRMVVGDFEVTALYDGQAELPQQILKGMSAKDIQKLLQRMFLAPDRPMLTAFNAFLVHTGRHLVLIDAGAAKCFGPAFGNVRNNIKASGYKLEDIDTVLLTHLHPDHACGVADESGAAVFPNATVWVAKEEAAYWLSEEAAARAPEGQKAVFKQARDAVAPYVANGKFKTWAAGDELLPGLAIAPSPGHTPGHSGYLFSSKGQNLLVWGDIVHNHAVQFAHPEVSIEFDSDRKKAVSTRKKVFAEVARQRLLVAGAHLPFPGIGYVSAEKNGYRWTPVEFGHNFPGTGAGAEK